MGTFKLNYKQALPVLGVLSIGASACSPTSALQRLETKYFQIASPNGVTVNFCTDPATEQKIVQKMVIILDHSGSNTENYQMAADGSGAPALVNGGIVINRSLATDPTGHTRYGDINTNGTLLNYLYNLPANDPANPQRYFALVDFNNQATTYPPSNGGFTADVKDFYNHVLQDAGGLYPANSPPNDGNATSYLSALASTYSIINGDVQSAKACAALPKGSASPGSWCPNPGVEVTSYYTIVFMSDGSPITAIGGVGIQNGTIVVTGPITITKEPANEILGQIGSLMSLSSETRYVAGMNLFTIYYYVPGNVDNSGQKLLADMATVGHGISYNALSGTNINYANFLPSSKHLKYTLADVFVTNSSVVMGNDGLAHLDSDRDGIPDDMEAQLGLDPNQTDTFGIGISDSVLYSLNGKKPCAKKNAKGICADPLPSLAACGSLKTSSVPGRPGAVSYPSSDPNGLNDCEKLVLNDNGGINNPDSNGDFIPDWLEFINGVSFQVGTAPAITSPGLDGLSIYQKIKTSLPVGIPAYQLLNNKPSVYDSTLVSSNDVQDCYKVVVNNLPTSGPQNTVRVDVILKNELLQGQIRYKRAQKQFPLGSYVLDFNDWNDAGEIAAGTWQEWQ